LPDVARSAVFRDGQIVVTMENGAEIRFFAVAENRRLASDKLNPVQAPPPAPAPVAPGSPRWTNPDGAG